MKKIILLTITLVLMYGTAMALTLQPGDEIASGPETSTSEVEAILLADEIDELLYKDNVGGSEEGPNEFDYTTVFDETPEDPSEATITHDGPGTIDTSTDGTYLLVKDGTQDPAWYLFDVSAWDGQETIHLSGFWPDQGAISHVAIYGGEGGGGTGQGDPIPEPATMLLFGTGLIGIVRVISKGKKKNA